MDVHYPTIDQPATSEYVLAFVRDMHRQQCQYDDVADPDASLTLESTVAEWREACDLLGWRELGWAHNEIWGISCSDAEWRAVLEPAHEKRLEDVCEFIARHARQPIVRPARLFGCTCSPAGVFLTVRSLLSEAGACANEIAPSTMLAPYTRQYSQVFLGPISQLAPGALPLVQIHTPVYDVAMKGILIGIACVVIAAWMKFDMLFAGGVLLLIVCYILLWIAARCMLPKSVEFGNLRTFRDLALALSKQEPPSLAL